MEADLSTVHLGPVPPGSEAGTPPPGELVEQLRAEVSSLREHNRRLEHLVHELRRALFGKRSEKLSVDERQLAFEELEAAGSEAEEVALAPADASVSTARAKPAPAARNLGHLPETLPRVERVIEPVSTQCPCGCGQMERIGEERSERLDIVPATLRVVVTIRPKYACRVCEQGVVQAPAPAHLLEGALPTEGTLAQVLVAKYAEHCPLYRLC